MVKVIVGLRGGSAATGSPSMNRVEQLKPLISTLRKNKVYEIDTARAYNNGHNEESLGAIQEATAGFTIATKAPAFTPGSLTYQNIIESCHASLKALKQESIELYYFHGPDSATPLEESCRAIAELHKQGKILRFGVSNISPAQVIEIHELCSRNGWIRPTVYQGIYNPLARNGEKNLLPTLRQHGMAFYGFSPLAGGFFSKPSDELRNPPAGSRMDQMKHFASMFINEQTLELHERLTKVCTSEGLTVKESTLRWLLHHSSLGDEDGILLGGSSPAQMEENLKACEGRSLPRPVVDCFEDIWHQFHASGKSPPGSF